MTFETLETRKMMSATTQTLAVIPEQPEPAILIDLNATSTATVSYGMTAGEKHAAEQLTSTFENSTTELQYDFIKNIDDGRGYTAGRAGFTTGTGDFHEVVRRYTEMNPSNPLAQYLPRLEELSDEFAASNWEVPAGDTWGLEGIESAWLAACDDADFLAAQDSLVDEWYYTPAMDRARELSLNHAISKGQIWDALIQHGDGTDNDSLSAMVQRTNARFSGKTPATGASETAWLERFLKVRIATLNNASNPATAEAWADSVSRVEVYQGLLKQGNLGLTGEMHVTVYGDEFVIYGVGSAAPDVTPAPTPGGVGTISGRVLWDGTGNGLTSDDIWGNEGRLVFIDADGDMYCDADELKSTTDADGNYRFEGLAAGSYNVRLDSVAWFFSTTPIAQQVNVQTGQTSVLNFAETSA